MAKRDKDLFDSLRARGVRKKVAKDVARATAGRVNPKVARRAMSDLASVVGEIRM